MYGVVPCPDSLRMSDDARKEAVKARLERRKAVRRSNPGNEQGGDERAAQAKARIERRKQQRREDKDRDKDEDQERDREREVAGAGNHTVTDVVRTVTVSNAIARHYGKNNDDTDTGTDISGSTGADNGGSGVQTSTAEERQKRRLQRIQKGKEQAKADAKKPGLDPSPPDDVKPPAPPSRAFASVGNEDEIEEEVLAVGGGTRGDRGRGAREHGRTGGGGGGAKRKLALAALNDAALAAHSNKTGPSSKIGALAGDYVYSGVTVHISVVGRVKINGKYTGKYDLREGSTGSVKRMDGWRLDKKLTSKDVLVWFKKGEHRVKVRYCSQFGIPCCCRCCSQFMISCCHCLVMRTLAVASF